MLNSNQTLETKEFGRVTVELELHEDGSRMFSIKKDSENTIIEYNSDIDNEYIGESLEMQEAITFLSDKLTSRELADLLVNLVYKFDTPT